MKTRNWLAVGSLAIALVVPGSILAADAVAFNKADQNGDFMITADELDALPELHAQFDKLDRNQDGFLDRREFNRGLDNALSTRAREAGG